MMRRRGWAVWVVACALAGTGCLPDTCSDIECVMNHLELTARDERVPLTEVPMSMIPMPAYTASSSAASGSFDLLVMPVSVPNYGDPLEMIQSNLAVHAGTGTSDELRMPTITNQPPNLRFLFDTSEASFDIEFTDPNGETPAYLLYPCDPTRGYCYAHCAWMTRSERDGLLTGRTRFNGRIAANVDFAAVGFYTNACTHLTPIAPPYFLAPGLQRCPQGTQVCGDSSCIPNGELCMPGSGTIGCALGQHRCGAACVPREQSCCDNNSQDVGCCPNGPDRPPCAPPVIAGPAVTMNVKPPAVTSTGGGGGGGGGSGGGSCPGGQIGSLRYCVQDGINGPCSCNVDVTSMCITPAFWGMYYGGQFPAQCAPQGAACVGADGRTQTAYCCPGLSCNGGGGNACGAGALTCQKI